MSRARELFFSIPGVVQPGNVTALAVLKEAAHEWRNAGRYFSAGYSMSVAGHVAWGTAEIDSVLAQSVQDYRDCVRREVPDSLESLTALVLWSSELRYLEPQGAATQVDVLREELAQRLITNFSQSPNAESYLVKGIYTKTDLDGRWEALLPVSGSHTESGLNISGDGQSISISIPSAFDLLVALGDYQGARNIIEICPNGFVTPGLRGRKSAVNGFVNPVTAVEHFRMASKAFAP
jgi:hypothetical protein